MTLHCLPTGGDSRHAGAAAVLEGRSAHAGTREPAVDEPLPVPA